MRLHQAAEARRTQATRRRTIEQRRVWGTRITWPERPNKGWLAEVREASGLTTRDVAARLDIDQAAVVRAEAAERNDAIKLGLLKRLADAMDADLHYVVLPRASVLQPTDSLGRHRRPLLRLKARRRTTIATIASTGAERRSVPP
jgi:transcriptional regulator with XRE-family HTH domain